MNIERVDQIMKFALAVAAHADEPWDRQLGAIHLIKYVYLADLAYAERHNGQTFTGANWRFYHYGPWTEDVNARVAPVVAMLDASERVFSSTKYEKDSIRWVVEDQAEVERVLSDMDRALPAIITSKVKGAVRNFGHDTTGLLHYVYTTHPMLRTAPGELIRFDVGVRVQTEPPVKAPSPPTAKAQKKEKEKFEKLKMRAREKIEEMRTKRAQRVQVLAPRYDEVFIEGQRWLDELEGEPLQEIEGEIEISDEVWKNPWRTETDVP